MPAKGVEMMDLLIERGRSGLPTLGRARLVGIGIALLIGLAIYLVGLPSTISVFGTALSDLTVPAALLVAFAGCVLAGASASAGRWRVVEIVVASVLGVAGGLLFAA